eukprot:3935741-Rhodomonas_salina.1
MHARRLSCWMACACAGPGVLGDDAEDTHEEAVAAYLVLRVLGCEESKGALVLVLFDGCVVLEVCDLDGVAACELDDDDGLF